MTHATGAAPSRLRSESPLRRLFSRPEIGALIGAILVFIIFAFLAEKNGFLRPIGIAGYLQIAAQIGILGAPVALLMIAGEFDLSLGSMVGITSIFLALMITQYHLDPVLAVVLTFALALTLGATNGWLVVRTRLPSFLITLASMLVLRGVTIAMTREITDQTIVRLPPGAVDNPALRLFSSPLFTIDRGVFRVELLWWLAVVVVGSWVLLRTRFGNWIFAVGGSAQAARYVGVPVSRVKIILFMTTAAAAALYSCIVVPQVGSANVNDGTGKEFQAIITAVVGGTLLTGGYGSVIGSAFGAFILGATALGILYAGINTDWYNAVMGVLLLTAVLVNTYVLRRASGTR
ncbi:MAG: ABC transporter permease [Chloroflexi bacterium]|nr:ABC transporter permease [Chloroflexota bacterium]